MEQKKMVRDISNLALAEVGLRGSFFVLRVCSRPETQDGDDDDDDHEEKKRKYRRKEHKPKILLVLHSE